MSDNAHDHLLLPCRDPQEEPLHHAAGGTARATPIALVTHAATAEGSALAQLLLLGGCEVFLQADTGAEVASLRAAFPAAARPLRADLDSDAGIERVVTHVARTAGRLDILVNVQPTHRPVPGLDDWPAWIGENVLRPLRVLGAAEALIGDGAALLVPRAGCGNPPDAVAETALQALAELMRAPAHLLPRVNVLVADGRLSCPELALLGRNLLAARHLGGELVWPGRLA